MARVKVTAGQKANYGMFETMILLGIGLCLGILSTISYMYLVPDGPLMVRGKAFNDTANELLECLTDGKKLTVPELEKQKTS